MPTLDVSAYRCVELADLSFDGTTFNNCILGPHAGMTERSTIANCHLTNCSQIASAIYCAIIRDCRITNLGKSGRVPLFLRWCVFDRVVISGKCSFVKIWDCEDSKILTSDAHAVLMRSAREFYKYVDWALDISNCSFTAGVDLFWVPGDKIRIGGPHQIRISKDQAKRALASLDFADQGGIRINLEWFLEFGPYDMAVVATTPSAHKKTGSAQLLRDIAAI